MNLSPAALDAEYTCHQVKTHSDVWRVLLGAHQTPSFTDSCFLIDTHSQTIAPANRRLSHWCRQANPVSQATFVQGSKALSSLEKWDDI